MAFISVSEFLLSSTSLAYVHRNVNYSAPVLSEVAVYNPDNSKTEIEFKVKRHMFLFSLHSRFFHCTQNTLYSTYFHFKVLCALEMFC